MRKVMFFVLAVSLASSVFGRERGRVVLHPAPPPPCVELVISVTKSLNVSDGWAVKAFSTEGLTVGTVFVGSLRKPGETSFTPIPGSVFTVESKHVGMYLGMQLWNGEWADGVGTSYPTSPTVFKPWPIGSVATFKVDITSREGVKTSSFTDILVGSKNPSIGLIGDPQVSVDRKTIFLTPTGPFNSPVALLFYHLVPVVGNKIEISEEVWNSIPEQVRNNVPLVVGSEYPSSHSVTKLVDLSIWEDKSKKVGNGIPVSTRINVPNVPGSGYPESVTKFIDLPSSSFLNKTSNNEL